MKRTVLLIRVGHTDKVIYGILLVMEGPIIKFACRTIENKAKTFPPGVYPLKLELSDAFKMELWELYDVVGHPDDPQRIRGEIKIHIANKFSQLKGCIGVGMNHQDIDDDGVVDVASSGNALAQFHKAMLPQRLSNITVIQTF
jgi:hypothetical protein